MAKFKNAMSTVHPFKGKWFSRLVWLLILASIGYAAWFYLGNKDTPDNDKRAGSKNRPVSVVVGEVKKGDITVSLSALGTVTPRNTVTVYPQVSGVLTQVYFKEGDMVEQGQVLAQIDPRSYEASLKQAQGALERDKMLLRNAEIDFKRYETLLAQDSVSAQVFDTQKALVEQYRGSVLTDQGLVDAAKLQVEFAKIVAPISGRIGLRQVDPGNLIQANNSTSLFVITQVSPTTVVFAVPQNLLGTYMQKLSPVSASVGANSKSESQKSADKGAGSDRSPKSLKSPKSKIVEIEAWDSENKALLDKGRLESIDNVIDLSTGTVKMRAIFSNAKSTLFANQFVNVKSILEVRPDVVYMPATAMQKGSIGTFVYKVNEDGKTVSVTPVKLGPTDEDKIQVESGLNPGDKVVVDGLDKLRDGANIVIGEAAKAGGPRAKRGEEKRAGDKGAEGTGAGAKSDSPTQGAKDGQGAKPAASKGDDSQAQAGKPNSSDQPEQASKWGAGQSATDSSQHSGKWDKRREQLDQNK
jgi:multidrug efflux system membrane fusion protein